MKTALLSSSLALVAGCIVGNASAAATPETSGECCVGACTPPLEKYYSIAKDLFGNVNCGECCMNPKVSLVLSCPESARSIRRKLIALDRTTSSTTSSRRT